MLAKKYNFKTVEPEIQKFWEEEEIFNFNPDNKNEIYSIDTPPPTVNGKIHIGHLSSYSHIDIVARYKRMKGYNVFYPFGFDDNGLPTERLVERNLKKRANEIPREEFVQKCLEETEKLEEKFKALFTKMGQSADWNYLYSTIDDRSRKTAQMSFLDLYKKGDIYLADKPALWCTECRTSIAQAELESQDIDSYFNYLKFNIKDDENGDFLEIATTRPEMLAACVSIFVHPDDDRYKDYVGKEAIVPLFDFSVPVLADAEVEMDKGTGVVMCCTFGDITDMNWVEKYNLPTKQAFDTKGIMTDINGKYEGMYSLKARKEIIKDLDEAGLLLKQEPITHTVSVHERCSTPMEIMNKKQWFIKTLDFKDKLLELGEEIDWHPSNMHNVYKNWVENIQWDWCISRQRYFGVMFPVWYCKECGEIMLADEEDLPVDPTVTQPKKACPHCGSHEFIPETDIMDTWMTSSVTPYINLDWANDFKENMLPMNLRPNAHDIIRTWDFYTIVKSNFHSDSKPWSDVMISGFVMADKNEKISKRKKNSKMEPDYLLDTYSSDVTRYWTTGASNGNDVIFSEEAFRRGKKLVTKLFNATKFAYSFLKNDEGIYNPIEKPKELLPMDRWIISDFNHMYHNYESQMDKYELSNALNTVEKFFWSFCDNYIEIVKKRLYNPDIYGKEAQLSGLWTLYHVLEGVLQCFAPFLPHITEHLYQEYFKDIEGKKSIHLTQLSPIESEEILESDYDNGNEFIDILGQIRRAKTESNNSVKAEIEECIIETPAPDFILSAQEDLKSVGNIKNIKVNKGDENKVEVTFSETAQ